MKLLAHLLDEDDIRKEQSLKEHSVQTAYYASNCLKNIGLKDTAYLCGLMHDVGKATYKYQQYLEDSYAGKKVIRGSVNHTFAGVIYILERYHANTKKPIECMTSEIISCAIGGHHGIFDCVDLDGNNGFLHRLNKDRSEICYEEAISNCFSHVIDENQIDELFSKAVHEVGICFQKIRQTYKERYLMSFQLGLVVRMLQSAVIYGDRRDTREFMTQRKHSETNVDWKQEICFLEEKLGEFNSNSLLNQVRMSISRQCRDFANRPTGIYRLNVPTGGGKTLASLRYALHHANTYQKKRIIFIIPLLSILDQNVKVIRDYISDENLVLEHHSNIVSEKENEEKIDEEKLDLYEVLTNEWGSPIIVSTLVQLLNILFKEKTSSISRMQALCDSVIVIDEVQSIPTKTMAMFNMAMNFLSQYCNTTIILSSATQPELDKLKDWSMQLALQPDMIRLSHEQMEVFKRSEIIDQTNPYGMDLEECVDFCEERIQENSSLLVICNTKTEASTLFAKINARKVDNWKVFHLSTSMCQQHRTDKLVITQEELSMLQKNLNKKEENTKVICISTQLVEAGVDFSFGCVVRVMAGIDNLAQAAGRCNRSNEYGKYGQVFLINLKNEKLEKLPDISRAKDSTLTVLEKKEELGDASLISEQAASWYYESLIDKVKNEAKYPIKKENFLYLAELLGNKNPYVKEKDFFLRQPFKTVGKIFQVFEEDSIDIIVPYKEGKDIIEQIRNVSSVYFSIKELEPLLKKAKPYTISIFKYQRENLDKHGLLEMLCDNRVLVLNEEAYDWDCGLIDIRQQPVEHFIL